MSDRPANLPAHTKRGPVPAPDHGTGADPAVPASNAPTPRRSSGWATLNTRVSLDVDEQLQQIMATRGLSKRAAVELAIQQCARTNTQ